MLLLPNELINIIFNNITNKKDLLQCQLVCYSFLEAARRAFYRKVVITHDRHHLHPETFLNFISAVTKINRSSRIVPFGLYIRTLLIDFEVPLENHLMPTPTEFEAFANACPHIETLKCPEYLSYLIDTQKQWTKVQRVLVDNHSLNPLLKFKNTLTSAIISGHQLDQLHQFPNLTQLEIKGTQPDLTVPDRITNLTLTCNSCSPTHFSRHPHLTRLDLTLSEPSPYPILASLPDRFPNLQHLTLRFTPHTTGPILPVLSPLIRPNHRLELFLDDHRLLKEFLQTSSHLKVSYSSCPGRLTGLPSLVLEPHQTTLRFQSFLESVPYLLPSVARLTLTPPSAYLHQPRSHVLKVGRLLELNRYPIYRLEGDRLVQASFSGCRLMEQDTLERISGQMSRLESLCLKDCLDGSGEGLVEVRMGLTRFRRLSWDDPAIGEVVVVQSDRSISFRLSGHKKVYIYCRSVDRLIVNSIHLL